MANCSIIQGSKHKERDTMKSRRFIIEFTNERIISLSELAIVGGMLGKSEQVKRLNRIAVDERKRSEPQIKNGDIALTYIGILLNFIDPVRMEMLKRI